MAKLITFNVQLAVGSLDETPPSAADMRDIEKNIIAALNFWRMEEGFTDGESSAFVEEVYSVSVQSNA